MNTKVTDVTLHINEDLEQWQRNVLADHLRLQSGVISIGYDDRQPHLLRVGMYHNNAQALNLIRMIERHGYHAQRIG